eukprot:g68912.t1
MIVKNMDSVTCGSSQPNGISGPHITAKILCDSHAGKIAHAVAYQAFYHDWIWQGSKQLSQLIKDKLSFSEPHFFTGLIYRSAYLKHNFKGIPYLWRKHCFEATLVPGKLLVRELRDSAQVPFRFMTPSGEVWFPRKNPAGPVAHASEGTF